MLPLKSRTPRTSAPVVTVGLIAANTLAFLYELTLPDRLEQAFFMSYTMVPARFLHQLAAPHVPLQTPMPPLGASGAISGVLGAYIVLYPRGRILTLVWLIFFIFTWDLPAFLILGYWFAIQFVSGISSVGSRVTGGVAWWAHIGGFLLGVWVVHIWPQRRRAAYYLETN